MQGDKHLLQRLPSKGPSDDSNRCLSVPLKSTVSNRILSLYGTGFSWHAFLKRRENLCWNLYNIRDQVQRIVSLGKLKTQRRIPFLRIADELSLRAEDMRLCAYPKPDSTTIEDDSDGDGVAGAKANAGESQSVSENDQVGSGHDDASDCGDDDFCTPL